eukprot:TRINITY_DN65850_c7_g10_i1.p1 TRINITY_DN65850_c7_g10~~TRINITY_DN65850_c7_g10_i1.p1  ORF type:complete len:563 (-),score=322.81 TRINITY_DN65850_c7_g10_i1:61-1749(-)
MVDGVALVVDASEGPMTQTKFVLSKALKRGLRPFVVINKIDRPSARLGEVENEIFDLFASLDANDDQLDYPVVYASARDGWAVAEDYDEESIEKAREARDVSPLFDIIIDHVSAPKVDPDAPFSMLVTQIESNDFLGKLLLGRVSSGSVSVGDTLRALDPNGDVIDQNVRIPKIFARDGLAQVTTERAVAGDIVSMAGFTNATVNSTLCDNEVVEPLPSSPIDPPTVSMTFSVNSSPISGQEGTKVTSTAILQRLEKECESNVALKMVPTANREAFEVHGRGELQLGVLIEEMRREGFEMSVSPPRVCFRRSLPEAGTVVSDADADVADIVTDTDSMMPREIKELFEPVEEVTIDVDSGDAGQVIEKMARRKGEMTEMQTNDHGRTLMTFLVPMRGLVGYRAEFQNDTRGDGILNHTFHGYEKFMGTIDSSDKGAMIATQSGKATAYALNQLEPRGVLFISPGTVVYPGMVIGEHAKAGDIEVNAAKAKAMSNMRTTSKDEKVRLAPPKQMTLEDYISYVRDDEQIEVTPTSVRLRKRLLDSNDRRRLRRQHMQQQQQQQSN